MRYDKNEMNNLLVLKDELWCLDNSASLFLGLGQATFESRDIERAELVYKSNTNISHVNLSIKYVEDWLLCM